MNEPDYRNSQTSTSLVGANERIYVVGRGNPRDQTFWSFEVLASNTLRIVPFLPRWPVTTFLAWLSFPLLH